MIHARLREYLETTTGLDFTNARGRAASPRRCKHCGMLILTGIDGEVCSFEADVDPDILTTQQERACALVDRATYELEQRGTRVMLHKRFWWDMAARPADESRVVPAHLCGAVFAGRDDPRFYVPPMTADAPPPF